eukprot:SAG31_NODE_2065_length_6530_cov_22.048515_6_plen_521_part_00
MPRSGDKSYCLVELAYVALAILLTEVDCAAKDLLCQLGFQGASNFHEDFRCGVCADIMQHPIVLSCTHRFCWQCTASSVAACPEDGWRCPTCSRPQALDPAVLCVSTPLQKFISKHVITAVAPRQTQAPPDDMISELNRLKQAKDGGSSQAPAPAQQGAQKVVNPDVQGPPAQPHAGETVPPIPLSPPPAELSVPSIDESVLPASLTGDMMEHHQGMYALDAPPGEQNMSVLASMKEQKFYMDLADLASIEMQSWPIGRGEENADAPGLYDDYLGGMQNEMLMDGGMSPASCNSETDYSGLPSPQISPVNAASVSTMTATAVSSMDLDLDGLKQHSGASATESSDATDKNLITGISTFQSRSKAAGAAKRSRPNVQSTQKTDGSGPAPSAGDDAAGGKSSTHKRQKRVEAQRTYRKRLDRTTQLQNEFSALRAELMASRKQLDLCGTLMSRMCWPTVPLAASSPRGAAMYAMSGATGAMISSSSSQNLAEMNTLPQSPSRRMTTPPGVTLYLPLSPFFGF